MIFLSHMLQYVLFLFFFSAKLNLKIEKKESKVDI